MEAKRTRIDDMTRPALLLDMAAFDALMKPMLMRQPKPEPEPFKVFYQQQYSAFSIPVIRSPYIGRSYQEDKPSILNDFDRWFRRAQSRAEERVYMARIDREEKSRRALESCWRE